MELGSGMRNTNKYTKLYSGGIPVFIEDNIFEIVIPMENVTGLQVGPDNADKETNKETSDKIIGIMKESGMLEHKGSTKKGKWIVH